MRKLLASLALCTALSPASAFAQDVPWWLSELRFGVFGHDIQLIEVFNGAADGINDKPENGVAINFEVMFQPLTTPGADFFRNPQPFIGAQINTIGHTSYIYGGVAWNHTFQNGIFIEGTFGLAVHDGVLNTPRDANGAFFFDGRSALGSRVLFRESLELGYQFNEDLRISAHYSHTSHGGFFADANEGQDFAGIRLSRTFGKVKYD